MNSILELAELQLKGNQKLTDAPIDVSAYVKSDDQLIAANIPPTDYLVDPWLAKGSVTLLYGPTKACKTFVGLELSRSSGTGDEFLGFSVTKVIKTLYLDGELSLAQLQGRVRKMSSNGNAHYFNVSEASNVVGRCLNLCNEIDQQAIDKAIEKFKPSILIIDNMTSLAARRDENDNSDTGLRSFKEWCLKLKAEGLAVLLVHHSGHDGKHSRGASSLKDFVDTIIRLRKFDEQHELIEFVFENTRDKRPEPDRLLFQVVDHGDKITLDRILAKAHSPEYALLPLLLAGKCKTQAQFAMKLNKSTATVSGYIKRLRKAKLVHTKELKLTAEGMKLASQLTEL